jgi:uncharacterized protein YdeI (YjbR/CyaY-like superfamily)
VSAEFKGLPVLAFGAQADWDAWLTAHGAGAPGLWLKLAKKDAGTPCVGKAKAIETALAHGWIDGQLQPFDDTAWLVRFTPRGPRSKWSTINRDTAERLMAEGRMTPAGQVQVDRAKADGRWDAAYAGARTIAEPDDLRAALDAEPKAKAFFATLTGANRYAVLYRIGDAKTPATRAARIDKFVAMLARGEVLHPKKD